MKKNRQFWAVIIFTLLSLAPFLAVMDSFVRLRSAVILDSEILWDEGKEAHFLLPRLKKGFYELRMESSVSNWNPRISLSWELQDKTSLKNLLSSAVPSEVELIKPVAKWHINENTSGENDLKVHFYNTNSTDRSLRIKLTEDRELLLEESSRRFLIFLAISLVLSLFLWRPLMTPVRSNAKGQMTL